MACDDQVRGHETHFVSMFINNITRWMCMRLVLVRCAFCTHVPSTWLEFEHPPAHLTLCVWAFYFHFLLRISLCAFGA